MRHTHFALVSCARGVSRGWSAHGARALLVGLGGLVLGGCVTVDEADALSLPAHGVSVLRARIDEGDLRYRGRKGDRTFEIDVRAFGGGSNEERANERLSDVDWSAEVDGDRLRLRVADGPGRSGADFDITGPQVLDIDAVSANGRIEFDRVEGVHLIEATSVRGSYIGDIQIFARNQADLEFYPYALTNASIDAGSVVLGLPIQLDYDLTVRTNGDSPLSVADLGWDDVRTDKGFFNGLRGTGDIEIDIFSGGNVTIFGLR